LKPGAIFVPPVGAPLLLDEGGALVSPPPQAVKKRNAARAGRAIR
jgi:hypothetical protein